MASPRRHRYSRSRSPRGVRKASKRRNSPSPSPPRRTREALNERLSRPNIDVRERTKRDLFDEQLLPSGEAPFAALGSRTKCENGAIFKGSEYEIVSVKEQKKIQIDICRSIPDHLKSHSPVRRRLLRPEKIVVIRDSKEGIKPIFDREEIHLWLPSILSATDQKRENLFSRNRKKSAEVDHKKRSSRHQESLPTKDTMWQRKRRSRSKSPDRFNSRMQSDKVGLKASIKDRLDSNNKCNQDGVRRRGGIASRLGVKPLSTRLDSKEPSNRIMDREELERNRPETKPWDINPEFVPTAGRYYEHDDRETQGNFNQRRFGGNFFRRRGSFGQGNYNNRKRRGNARSSSPAWKHDLYEEEQKSNKHRLN